MGTGLLTSSDVIISGVHKKQNDNQIYKIIKKTYKLRITFNFVIVKLICKYKSNESCGLLTLTYCFRVVFDKTIYRSYHVKNIQNYIRFKREAKRFLVKRATSKELSVLPKSCKGLYSATVLTHNILYFTLYCTVWLLSL